MSEGRSCLSASGSRAQGTHTHTHTSCAAHSAAHHPPIAPCPAVLLQVECRHQLDFPTDISPQLRVAAAEGECVCLCVIDVVPFMSVYVFSNE